MWEVKINGADFVGWKNLKFSRSIRENVGQFSITTTRKNNINIVARANDLITIFYKNNTVFTGFIDSITSTGSRNGNEIIYSGRDPICDLVDSSIPDKAKLIKGSISLNDLIGNIFRALGITKYKSIDTTIGKIGIKKVKIQKAAASSDKAIDFIAKFAASKQAWLISNEFGDLEIMRAGESDSELFFYFLENGNTKNNIIDAELQIDLKKIFKTIKVRGKGSITFGISDSDVTNLVDINGSATDDWSRPTRYLEIKNHDIKTKTDAIQRARDEVNQRKAAAYQYILKTNFFVNANGEPLRIGQIVFVEDEIREVHGKHVISSFEINYDKESGTNVSIVLAPPQAYQIVDIDARQDKITKIEDKIRKLEKVIK